VVEYRRKYLEQMQVYEKKMPEYVGDDCEEVLGTAFIFW